MEDSIPDRYEKKPMLILIENYILDTLGALEPAKVAKLNDIVCRTFGGKDWRQALRRQFHLPPDADQSLLAVWKQRQEEAEATQQELSPEDFAREQADQIFRDLGD